MASRTIRLIILPWIFVILLASECLAKQTNGVIRWQTYDTAPNFILSGEYKGQGFVEQLLEMLIEQMPEYTHQMDMTSQNRALENLHAVKPVCHPSLVATTKRKKYIHFSTPVFVSPTNRLILRRGALQDKLVNLAQVLSDENIRFALLKNRSFGRTVDNIIEEHKDGHRILQVANETNDHLFKLIGARRIDATLGYQSELNFFQIGKQKTNLEPLISLPIRGNLQYVMGRVGCSKTTWGQQVVERINEVMLKLKRNKQYQLKMTRWWQDERQSQPYLDFYQTRFLTTQ